MNKLRFFLLLLLMPLIVSAKNVVVDDSLPLNRKIVKTAKEFEGINYNFGGNKIAGGLDCSSFVQKIYGFYGIMLPRSAAEQFEYGNTIEYTNQLMPGDLVFFETYRPGPSHVGIYSDKDPLFVHASSSRGITESSIKSSYFRDRYYGAKRILSAIGESSNELVSTVYEKAKIVVKESAEELKRKAKEVAEFQANKRFLAKQKKEMDGVASYVKTNMNKVKSVCPVVYEKPVKTYVYNTSTKTNRLRMMHKFGEVMYLIGGSKEIDLGSSGKLITKACILTADKKNIDLIDSRSLSFFPAEDLIDKNCITATPINKDVVVKSKIAQLRLYDHDYENVFGNIIPSYKLMVDITNKGNKLKTVGIVKDGERAGDYCVHYKNNIVLVYEGDVE